MMDRDAFSFVLGDLGGRAQRIWLYAHDTDDREDIAASGYFKKVQQRGVRVGDPLLARLANSEAVECTFVSIASNGDGTVEVHPNTTDLEGRLAPVEASSRPRYRTRALAHGAVIPGSADVVLLDGRSTPGDGGGGTYKRADSNPQHLLSFQDASGDWWEYDERADPPVTAFGAIPDAYTDGAGVTYGTDATAAFQAWVDYYDRKWRLNQPGDGWRNQYRARTGPGNFRISGSVNLTVALFRARFAIFDFEGCNLFADGENKIPFDMTEAQYVEVRNFKLRGDSRDGFVPLCAIKTGRIRSNNTAAHLRFVNCTTMHSGDTLSCFKIAAMWQVASENTYEWRCYWHNDREATSDSFDTPIGKCYAAAYDCANFCAYSRGKPVTAVGAAGGHLTFTITGHGWTTGTVVVPSRKVDRIVPVLGGDANRFDERAYAVEVVDANTIKLRLWNPTTEIWDGALLASANFTTGTFTSGDIQLHREHYRSEFQDDQRPAPWTRHSQLQCRRWNVWSCDSGTAAILQGPCDHTELDGHAKAPAALILVCPEYAPSNTFADTSIKIHLEPGTNPVAPQNFAWFVFCDVGTYEASMVNFSVIESAALVEDSFYRIYDDGLGSTHTVNFTGGETRISRIRAGSDKLLAHPEKFSWVGHDLKFEGAGDHTNNFWNIEHATFSGGRIMDPVTRTLVVVPPRRQVLTVPLVTPFNVEPPTTNLAFTSTAATELRSILMPRWMVDGTTLVVRNIGSFDITLKTTGNLSLPGGTDFTMTPDMVIQFICTNTVWKILSYVE
jgi:hypothetical protein